jgi:hypothetical protein
MRLPHAPVVIDEQRSKLRAAADVARSPIPIEPNSNRCAGGSPGVARNIPMIAVNTMSDTTRGFPSCRSCPKTGGDSMSVFIFVSR